MDETGLELQMLLEEVHTISNTPTPPTSFQKHADVTPLCLVYLVSACSIRLLGTTAWSAPDDLCQQTGRLVVVVVERPPAISI